MVLLWPSGMVLGITRHASVSNAPLEPLVDANGRQVAVAYTQAMNFVLIAAGYVLGHKHGALIAREKMANILLLPLAAMLVLGVYLKLHIHERML